LPEGEFVPARKRRGQLDAVVVRDAEGGSADAGQLLAGRDLGEQLVGRGQAAGQRLARAWLGPAVDGGPTQATAGQVADGNGDLRAAEVEAEHDRCRNHGVAPPRPDQ